MAKGSVAPKMVGYAESLDHQAASMRQKKPQLDHLRVYEGENGGHIVEHHMDRYGSAEPERYPFEKADGVKPKLPEGHVLQHIAKQMHIPHEVIKQSEPRGESGHDKEERAENASEHEADGDAG